MCDNIAWAAGEDICTPFEQICSGALRIEDNRWLAGNVHVHHGT
jgi:hypothetical protein